MSAVAILHHERCLVERTLRRLAAHDDCKLVTLADLAHFAGVTPDAARRALPHVDRSEDLSASLTTNIRGELAVRFRVARCSDGRAA